ncbi:MAG: peptidylprolyl isomerase [Myxococcales bacterium]|nr:peptidylprolyl isomerase [Myxococcales bacterium]MDH3485576.1 peptidylprolyl isomerase [Myxococcales bacterium]
MRTAALLILSGVLVFGCSKNEKTNTPNPGEETEPPSKEEEAKLTDNKPSQAPDQYVAELDTTKGPILIEVHRDWSPHGADRFYELVQNGYYDDVAFFRVIGGFMAQVGISGDPALNAEWREKRIPDDPVKGSNTRGTVSFATSGPNSRTTQFFINFVDNSRLDGMGFSPFGKVKDMSTVDALHAGYGEGAPRGRGPSQALLQSQGNAYLKDNFPNLDYIKSAKIIE